VLNDAMGAALRDIDPAARSFFKLFNRMDDDGSGKVAYVEFEGLIRADMHVTKHELPTRQVEGVWKAMDHSGCGFITAYEFSMLMKAASLGGGEKVDFRAHKELAKGTKGSAFPRTSPGEQPPARSFRGQPKPPASVSPTRGGRPADRRGEIAAAAKSSRKAQAKLASSGSAPALTPALTASPPRRRSLVSLSSVGNARYCRLPSS
jgi:hypothetical protein